MRRSRGAPAREAFGIARISLESVWCNSPLDEEIVSRVPAVIPSGAAKRRPAVIGQGRRTAPQAAVAGRVPATAQGDDVIQRRVSPAPVALSANEMIGEIGGRAPAREAGWPGTGRCERGRTRAGPNN